MNRLASHTKSFHENPLPTLQRLALTTAVVLTPFWLSGCATGFNQSCRN